MQRLTVDSTFAQDLLKPDRPRHEQALAVVKRAKAGELDLAFTPQGHRLDVDGDLAKQLAELFENEGIGELRQVARVSDATYPSDDFYPGQHFKGFDEAWEAEDSAWPSHDGKPPQGAADRFHVETHIFEERDIFITNDRALIKMCHKLRDNHGFPVEAMTLEDFAAGL